MDAAAMLRLIWSPLDYGFEGPGRVWEGAIAVEQQIIRTDVQAFGGAAHSLHRRPQDVEPVNLFGRAEPHPEGDGLRLDLLQRGLPLRGRKLLAVVNADEADVRREDHRRRHNRPGQAPPPRLVHPGHAPVALLPESFFARKGRHGVWKC